MRTWRKEHSKAAEPASSTFSRQSNAYSNYHSLERVLARTMGETLTDSSLPSCDRVEPGSVNIPPLVDFPATSTQETVDANRVARDIIAKFNDALAKKDNPLLSKLFLKDVSFWRDHLALTWSLRTIQSREKILLYLNDSITRLRTVDIDSSSAFRAPHFGPIDAFGDVKGIQFFIQFETEVGRGEGVVSLAEENGEWSIFTISTVLTELKGYEELVGKRRAKGVEHGGNPDRKNWMETREEDAEFKVRDPTVLIIGTY